MPEQGNAESGLKRLAATLAHSAEYSIALGLIVVCVVVGGALLLLDGGSKTADAPEAIAPAESHKEPVLAEAEEKAALEGWNQQLQGDFKQIEQQRRASEEAAARERQRQETQRADRAAVEQELQRVREAAAAAERKRAEAPAPVAAVRPPPPPPVAPARAAVRVEPTIDWSSCRRPQYPSMSIDRREEGTVSVGVDLDASGKVKVSRIAESSGHRQLDVVAQRAIERCAFRPATVDGVAQAASAIVRFAWKLN